MVATKTPEERIELILSAADDIVTWLREQNGPNSSVTEAEYQKCRRDLIRTSLRQTGLACPTCGYKAR